MALNVSDAGITIDGKTDVMGFRLMVLLQGVKAEARGIRVKRRYRGGRSCTAILKDELKLPKSWSASKVLEYIDACRQFDKDHQI
jgi:hypothetical protein